MLVDTWTLIGLSQAIVVLGLVVGVLAWRVIHAKRINGALHDECIRLTAGGEPIGQAQEEDAAPADGLADMWAEVREAQHKHIVEAIEARTVTGKAVELFDAYRGIDEALGIESPELPAVPAAGDDASMQVEMAAVRQDLERAEATIAQLKSAGGVSAESATEAKDEVDTLKAELEQAQDMVTQLMLEGVPASAGDAARGNGDDIAAELASTKQALAAATATIETLTAQVDTDNEPELKALLRQFTSNSRDMLTCIQKLEGENKALKAQLEQEPA